VTAKGGWRAVRRPIMLPIIAHIAGVPVEETALSFGPVFLASGGIATLKLREQMERRRERKRRLGLSRGSKA
jgi:hypothetical protein